MLEEDWAEILDMLLSNSVGEVLEKREIRFDAKLLPNLILLDAIAQNDYAKSQNFFELVRPLEAKWTIICSQDLDNIPNNLLDTLENLMVLSPFLDGLILEHGDQVDDLEAQHYFLEFFVVNVLAACLHFGHGFDHALDEGVRVLLKKQISKFTRVFFMTQWLHLLKD